MKKIEDMIEGMEGTSKSINENLDNKRKQLQEQENELNNQLQLHAAK